MRKLGLFFTLSSMALLLGGCAQSSLGGISKIYSITTLLSLVLIIGYGIFYKPKNTWFYILFGAILTVNVGYFSISVSKTVEEALLANRISYLGSVFLPLAMLMIILSILKISYKKRLLYFLLAVGAVVFFIAASPGYLDIYYKDVVLETINGSSVLKKTYGPLHLIYYVYLFGYFLSMIAVTVKARIKHKEFSVHSILVIVSVFVNIGIWLIEQFIKFGFEVLSISYIICGLFLLGTDLIARENERLKELINSQAQIKPEDKAPALQITKAAAEQFLQGKTQLTNTEQQIYNLYIQGKSTAQVLEALNIKENTLKFHNKNIYSKLNVSSRKELIEIHKNLNL